MPSILNKESATGRECNGNGRFCRTGVNKKRYDTVTFAIGGREFYALVRSLAATARER